MNGMPARNTSRTDGLIASASPSSLASSHERSQDASDGGEAGNHLNDKNTTNHPWVHRRRGLTPRRQWLYGKEVY
jgi:hypothetical protein